MTISTISCTSAQTAEVVTSDNYHSQLVLDSWDYIPGGLGTIYPGRYSLEISAALFLGSVTSWTTGSLEQFDQYYQLDQFDQYYQLEQFDQYYQQ